MEYYAGVRPDECHGYRIILATRGGYDLNAGHAWLSLNNGLDFLGADQETAQPHRVTDPRLKNEALICKVSEVAGPKRAFGIDCSRGC